MSSTKLSNILEMLDTWNASGEIPYHVYGWLHDEVSSLDLWD